MIGPSTSTRAAIAPWRWGIVWFLFAATLINYTDRLALNNTQRYLLPEFEPDPQKQNQVYGDVLLAFGLSFGLFQLLAGFLIDRLNLRWIYLGAIVIWSAAGVATGFIPAGAITMLIVCRVFLGIGEAFNWPAAVASIRRVIPRESRGLANGIFHSGSSIGALATPFLVILFVQQLELGWRPLFLLVGGVGFIWAICWMRYTAPAERQQMLNSKPSRDEENPDEQSDTLPFLAVFKMRIFWIFLISGICTNLCWHFYNQWFPRYLTQDLRVSATTEQAILAGFFIAADLGSLVTGWTTRRIIRSGYTVERTRKMVGTMLALIVIISTIPAAFFFEPGPAMSARELLESRKTGLELVAQMAVFFAIASASMGGFAIVFNYAQDILPRHTAKILGTMGCTSWLVISGVTEVIGRFDLAGKGKYGVLFLAIGCVPLIAAGASWLWPEPGDRG